MPRRRATPYMTQIGPPSNQLTHVLVINHPHPTDLGLPHTVQKIYDSGFSEPRYYHPYTRTPEEAARGSYALMYLFVRERCRMSVTRFLNGVGLKGDNLAMLQLLAELDALAKED